MRWQSIKHMPQNAHLSSHSWITFFVCARWDLKSRVSQETAQSCASFYRHSHNRPIFQDTMSPWWSGLSLVDFILVATGMIKRPRVQVHLPEVHISTITVLLIIKGLKLHLYFHMCEAVSYIPTYKQQGTRLGRWKSWS